MSSPFVHLLQYNFKAREKMPSSANPFLDEEQVAKKEAEASAKAKETANPIAIDATKIIMVEDAGVGVDEDDNPINDSNLVNIIYSTGSYDRSVQVEGPYDTVVTDIEHVLSKFA